MACMNGTRIENKTMIRWKTRFQEKAGGDRVCDRKEALRLIALSSL
jgi:hypothetical protein